MREGFIPADILEARRNPEELGRLLCGLGFIKELRITKDGTAVNIGLNVDEDGRVELHSLKRLFEVLLGRHYKITKAYVYTGYVEVELRAED